DGITLFAEGAYGRVKGNTLGAQRRDLGSRTIYQDNAFLPESVADTMAEYGLESIPFGRIWNDLGHQRAEVKRETYRAVVGIKAEMWSDWTFDAYYQFGQTDYSQRGYNTTINSRLNFAVDAVWDGDNIVCRGVRDGVAAAAGCVPINPFGHGSATLNPAAVDYVTGTVEQQTRMTQNVVAATVQGTL